MKSDAAKQASEIEAQVEEYPEERGEILLEAAQAWVEAGNPTRALELWESLVELGGEDGCYARCERADFFMGQGEIDRAYAELALLARDPGLHDGHCTIAAELLEEHGDVKGAADWYDRGVARLDPGEIGEPGSIASMMMLQSRRHVREALGLPRDATDDLASRLTPWQGQRVPVDLEEIHDLLDAGIVPEQLRLLTFQRVMRSEAQRRWPGAYEQSDEEYYEAAELRWRELSDSGVRSILVIPANVSQLCEYAESVGGSPLDSEVKAGYARSFPQAEAITWPPQRNEPCWCGSGAKYKKCCLRFG